MKRNVGHEQHSLVYFNGCIFLPVKLATEIGIWNCNVTVKDSFPFGLYVKKLDADREQRIYTGVRNSGVVWFSVF